MHLNRRILSITHRDVKPCLFTCIVCVYAMFTLDVCVCVCINLTIKFNIVSMETPTQTHRMGLNPFCAFSIDTMLNLTVTLMQTQTQTSSVNRALRFHQTSRIGSVETAEAQNLHVNRPLVKFQAYTIHQSTLTLILCSLSCFVNKS